jgi:hypothetical protein
MKRDFNPQPYPLVQSDTRPPITIQIGDSTGAAADFSAYPSIVVRGYWRERNASSITATITLSTVDATVGQFKIDSWSATALGVDEGRYEIEIEIDYQGDGSVVETVFDTIQFKVWEDFS